jgi:hypothetical protein
MGIFSRHSFSQYFRGFAWVAARLLHKLKGSRGAAANSLRFLRFLLFMSVTANSHPSGVIAHDPP